MSDDLPEEMRPGLDRLQARLDEQLAQARKTKIGINALYLAYDLPTPYTELDEGTVTKIRRGQFYGQPLATCVRTILEMRQAAKLGAASVAEIYCALKEGGYLFEAKDDENAKNGLRQSLRKNPIFHRIPSGEWGMLAWFPNAKVEKDKDDADDNGSVEKIESAETPASAAEPVTPATPTPAPATSTSVAPKQPKKRKETVAVVTLTEPATTASANEQAVS